MESTQIPRDRQRCRGTLHPLSFRSFDKRTGIIRGLGVFIVTTQVHGRTLSRILLRKPPKLKGAALSGVVTGRLKINFGIASKPILSGPNSLTKILASLRGGSILFVSRVRQLDPVIRRCLCSTVRSCQVSVVVSGKPDTHSVRVSLTPFALIKTAAHDNLLADPLETHFKVGVRLRCCRVRALAGVILHDTSVLGIGYRLDTTHRVTSHDHNAPHVTGTLLHHIHSFTRIGKSKRVSGTVSYCTLRTLGVSHCNLSRVSGGLLAAVVSGFGNKPMKLAAVTATLKRSPKALRRICRPFLVGRNFVGHAPHNHRIARLTCARLKQLHPSKVRDSLFWLSVVGYRLFLDCNEEGRTSHEESHGL